MTVRWKEKSWSELIDNVGRELLRGAQKVDVGEWHAMDVKGQPHLVSHELMNVIAEAPVPTTKEELVKDCYTAADPQVVAGVRGGDSLMWAEEQFQERVSREPLNPPPSAQRWHHDNEKHLTVREGGEMKFTHTYPERFWPKFAPAGFGKDERWRDTTRQHRGPQGYKDGRLCGIRFEYGDLDDVVNLLARSPYTRQATLPIFFPEDTGAVHGGRIPCTLHYHFMLRQGKLHIFYSIRSVDFVRHFRDDVYMAGRLLQWVLEELQKREQEKIDSEDDAAHPNFEPFLHAKPGNLTMHIYSLHYFEGDRARMEREYGV